ncbi:MAG: 3-phosphoshikimate 1-carboxyvinyltransferase, partial [Candidatus Binatia bacterium]
RVPGDKSIAHRAVMFNAAGEGEALVRGLPSGHDVASTMAAMRRLGAGIEATGPGSVRVRGRAMKFDPKPGTIDCENSGTTMRLLSGLLAGQDGLVATLVGDASLSKRPMTRVAAPLAVLGARIQTTDGHAPLTVQGSRLRGAAISLAVASAQLKSAVLLAGLQAGGVTEVTEPIPTRDHTEKLLAAMGIPVRAAGATTAVEGPAVPACVDVAVPGDPSSAAFLLVAAALVKGSDVTVEGLCLNPTRLGFVEVLRRMGANIECRVEGESGGEPVGSIRCRASRLMAFEIGPSEVPAAIDELPLLAVAAAFADGDTVIRGAAELRVKESDRIASTAALLEAFGVEVEVMDDGMVVHGGSPRGGGSVATHGDHRIAMAAAVAALAAAPGGVHLDDAAAVGVSFPEFFSTLGELGA